MIKTIDATNNHYTVSDTGIVYKDGIKVPIKHQPNGYTAAARHNRILSRWVMNSSLLLVIRQIQ